MKRKKPLVLPQPIGDVLSAAFKRRGMAFRLEENTLFKLWPQAVGAQIARETKPERLHAGTLFVRTTSSVWVQQLHFMKEEIRQKLNEHIGKQQVKDIHFSVGYQPPKPKDKTAGKRAVLKASDKKMIEESTAKLSDPELAEIVRRVMEKEISLRRSRQA